MGISSVYLGKTVRTRVRTTISNRIEPNPAQLGCHTYFRRAKVGSKRIVRVHKSNRYKMGTEWDEAVKCNVNTRNSDGFCGFCVPNDGIVCTYV